MSHSAPLGVVAASSARSRQSSYYILITPFRVYNNPSLASTSLHRILFTAAAGCAIITSTSVMKVLDIPRSGKRGNRVWQRNRYCQYSYPAFVPFNPRSPAQTAVRAHFGAVSARWRLLTEAQRRVWMAVASTKKTKPRLLQCGRLPGFNFFMKTNVGLANRGLAQVDRSEEHTSELQAEAANRLDLGSFDQPPIGPELFLRAKRLLEEGRDPPE